MSRVIRINLKKKTFLIKKRIFNDVLIVFFLLPCVYAYTDDHSGWKLYYNSLFSLGNLYLLNRFMKKAIYTYRVEGWGGGRKIIAYFFFILIGGNVILNCMTMSIISFAQHAWLLIKNHAM